MWDVCSGHKAHPGDVSLVQDTALFVHRLGEAGRAKFRQKNETDAHGDAQPRGHLAPDTERDGG